MTYKLLDWIPQFLIIFDEGKNIFSFSYVRGEFSFRVEKNEYGEFFSTVSHDVTRQKYRSRRVFAERRVFSIHGTKLILCVSLERKFRVEKSDTRADYVYVERISNGQTDPIRRQVGLPKFSIMQRFTQFFHLSSFRRFFLFLFLFFRHKHL